MTDRRSIFQLYPLVPVTLCFITGIAAGSRWAYTEWWLALAAACTIAACTLGKHGKWQSMALLAGFGFAGAFLSTREQQRMNIRLPENEITYEAVVATEAKDHPKSWSADIVITSGSMQGKTVKAYFSKTFGTGPVPTERFVATSRLAVPRNNYGTRFDYAAYLRQHGICATTFIMPWQYQHTGFGTEKLSPVTAVSARLRLLRIKVLRKIGEWGMPKDAEALIAGIALGHKNSISREMRDAYSQAGAAHVLALSGLHLGIIWALFGTLFVRRWRAAGSTAALITVWIYVMFAGLPLSAVRSAIMLTICSVATMSGRSGTSLNTLAFAALTILIFNPAAINDLGFRLSFSAVAFILIFTRPLTEIISLRWQQRHKLTGKLWHVCIISTIANLGTLPFVVFYFSRIPLYVIVTNLVAVPLVTAILWLFAACMMMMLAGVPSIAFNAAVTILGSAASGLNGFMSLIASLPFSSIEDVSISAAQAVVMYVGIIAFLWSIIIYTHKIKGTATY